MFKYIIPHIPQNTQVSFSVNAAFPADSQRIHPALKIPPGSTIRQAFVLYDAGLNVFPQPRGKKAGYPWKRLLYTRLHRDDSSYGLSRLFAGQCNIAVMCGRTSGNLFVIDCETKACLEANIAELRRRQIPLWVAKTRRGGHIYLRAREGEVENIASGVMQDQEIKGRDGYVLAPPSLHPSGKKYTWLIREGQEPPTISIHTITWLRTKSGAPIRLRAKRHSEGQKPLPLKTLGAPARLSAKTIDYLKNGDRLPEGTRNNRLFAAACDLYANGWSQADTESALTPLARGSGLDSVEIKRTIASAYSKTRTPACGLNSERERQSTWQEALAFAMHAEWPGKNRHTTRTLLLALVEQARISSNYNQVFRASIRELSQRARISTTTTQKILKELQNKRFPVIFHCGHDKNSGASLWRFSELALKAGKEIISKSDSGSPAPPWLSASVSVFLTEAAERDALGLGGVFVYRFLLSFSHPLRRSELARASGLSLHQIDYAVRKLVSHGLVCRTRLGYVAVDVGDDRQLAEHVGAQGRGLARRARYLYERQLFVGRLLFDARLRAERGAFLQAGERGWLPPLSRVPEHCQRDSLIMMGVELGAVVVLEDGTWFDRETLRR